MKNNKRIRMAVVAAVVFAVAAALWALNAGADAGQAAASDLAARIGESESPPAVPAAAEGRDHDLTASGNLSATFEELRNFTLRTNSKEISVSLIAGSDTKITFSLYGALDDPVSDAWLQTFTLCGYGDRKGVFSNLTHADNYRIVASGAGYAEVVVTD
ncbi:MAG: hypothetical protein LBK56_07605 [Gracilibacteraceae bacterium]|jgi:hypothetical protein|nr:hypothetical protein [Gracilibacteraceae bacterium]